jgi:hypothetical protein
MVFLELETPEAKYINDMRGLEHFGIDCACKGKDGAYTGSHYKDADEISEKIKRGYSPLGVSRHEHTFYLSELLFLDTMEFREKDGLKPLIIVCDDCGREFPFTSESYFELKDKMGFEYNRKLRLQELENKKDE